MFTTTISEATRESVRQLDRRFTLPSGAVDLLAVFGAIKATGDEGQMWRYIQASRVIRAEARNALRH